MFHSAPTKPQHQQASPNLQNVYSPLETILDASPLAIFTTDLSGVVTSWNASAQRIFGWAEHECIGQFLPIVPTEYLKEFEIFRTTIIQGQSVVEQRCQRLHKNGTLIHVSLSAAPLKDKQNNIVGYLAMIADMTKHVQIEEAKRKAEQQLEQQRALSIRSDRLRALGEMATGMAHELNQPLQGIRGLAERCVLKAKRNQVLTQEEVLNRLNDIVNQTERMTHIIEHTRLFAKEAGHPIVQSVNVNDVVKDATKLLVTQFRARGVHTLVRPTSHLPQVKINPFSLEEVIINLLLNARDAVEENLKAEPDLTPPHIVIQTKKNHNRVKIIIKDQGIGIPSDLQTRIFEPFFTTKSSDQGTGLGLSVSQSIVEQFGGQLEIAPQKTGGTQATISFPMEQNHETQNTCG